MASVKESRDKHLDCQWHCAKKMSVWSLSLSDGMSEKTLSDKETNGSDSLNAEWIISAATFSWFLQ